MKSPSEGDSEEKEKEGKKRAERSQETDKKRHTLHSQGRR
jgi:hypothetical protein